MIPFSPRYFLCMGIPKAVYCKHTEKRTHRQRADERSRPCKGKGADMLDILFWAFFGIGFLVMLAMVVSAFLSIRDGRRRKESWRRLEGESSILRQ